MKWTSLLLLFPTLLFATDLCDEAKLAKADAMRLPKEEAPYWRYMTLYNIPERDRILYEKICLLYEINALSQKVEFVRPTKVGPTLYRINVLEAGENFCNAYEKLAFTNPYFPCFEKIQLQLVTEPKVVVQKIYVDRPGGFVEIPSDQVKQGEKVYERVAPNSYRQIDLRGPPVVAETDPKDVKIASYLPAEEMNALVGILKTKAPLIRGDWFFYRTAISLNRQGDGYYDFHNIKSKKDALELAGVDLKIVERLQLELAAMIGESDVAVNRHRQVWWIKSYIGSWWQTFDIDSDPVGKKNLIRLQSTKFDKPDFDHQAEEAFFTLPNRLWGFLANSNLGVLQKSVPDTIASDDTTTSKDKKIHVGPISCARCHEEGLRPIDDWGRSVYAQAKDGQALLASPDPKKLLRLKQLYLSDMPTQLKLDNEIYATALKKLNGMTPQELAQGLKKVWREYSDTPRGMDEIAIELGVKPEFWRKALTNHVESRTAKKILVDPHFAGLLKGKKLLRPNIEELFPVMQAVLKEGLP